MGARFGSTRRKVGPSGIAAGMVVADVAVAGAGMVVADGVVTVVAAAIAISTGAR